MGVEDTRTYTCDTCGRTEDVSPPQELPDFLTFFAENAQPKSYGVVVSALCLQCFKDALEVSKNKDKTEFVDAVKKFQSKNVAP